MAAHFSTEREIPGPRGLPLVGVIPMLARDPFGYLVGAARDYGGLVRMRLGPATVYLVSDPAHVRHILVDNHANYWKGPILRGIKLIIGDGIFGSDGQLWQRQRRLMSPAFHRPRLTAMIGVMTDVVEAATVRWNDRIVRKTPVDMLEEMVPINIEIVLRTLFGTSIDYSEIAKLRAASDVIFHHSEKLVFSFFLPMRIPRPGHRRFIAALSVVDEVVERIIAERRKDPADRGDLLSMLLLAHDDEGTQAAMDDRQVRDEVMSILMAGYESTAAALGWTWYLLSQHPDADARLQTELDFVLGGRVPSLQDLPRLVYTRQVISESLRLYPPFPTFFRTSYGRDQLGPYNLPPDAALIISPYVTHRLTAHWPDPEEFDPTRFDADHSTERPNEAYYPFGLGRRLCIGANLSLLEQQVVVATVAQRFDREIASGYVLEPHYDIALRPRNGVPMMLTPR
ncbi:cytochrome P450 [Rhodococcus opacus]|uniref:cytochrome P450 n=1 Tax=Rhodococcus opacus TaxID=37919 RepID=UPI001C449ED8|nr:cytochrome P450 [Rhodococcus opacus]MBV6757019.1 cytochrome P450 [Rhodococcus opacus]